jgi:hypothetical protein
LLRCIGPQMRSGERPRLVCVDAQLALIGLAVYCCMRRKNPPDRGLPTAIAAPPVSFGPFIYSMRLRT